MNESPLKAWILASMDGKIICAHCSCVAGLSETCSHVAAICFAVSTIAEVGETKSVTDMLCKWNVPSFKDVSMSSVKEINWRYGSQEHKTRQKNFLKYCNSITPFSDERIDEFIKKCHSDGDNTALGTVIMSSEVRRKTKLKDEIFLASLYNAEYKNKSLAELIDIGKSISLKVSDDEVKEISQITSSKEKSKFYIGLRRGRISGSNFKSCCITAIENPSLTTINYMINPRNLDNIPSITYQIKNRKKAIQQYKRETMSDHENFVYSSCGLIINPRLPYFVGSPDGIASCSCHGNGCVVIKCLKILESGGSFEALTARPNNILNKEGNEYELEKTHEFYYQVQLQINLISLKYCDLVLWSPNDFLVIRVQSDFDFWDMAMKKASAFHERVVMPELLGKFYTKYSDTHSEANDEEKESELVGLEVEILYSDEELIGLEIDVLWSGEDSDGDESVSVLPYDHLSTFKIDSQHESENGENILPSFTETGIFNTRNLMNLAVDDILITFSDHEDELKRIYGERIKELKRNYASKDLPELVAMDIVNEEQLKAMAAFAESKLVQSLEEEHNSTDVIFDAILPEWALAAFCKKFELTRYEAIDKLKLQTQSLIENNDFGI